MPAQDNTALIRQFFDAVNAHDADRATSFLDSNAEWYNVTAPGATIRGPQGLKQLMQSFWSAFPDNKVEIVNLIPADDSVTVEYVGRGTQTGPFATPLGQIPPSGRKMEVRFCDVYQIKSGKIVSGHSYFDMATMLQQLGAMPRLGQRGGLTP